MSIKNDKNNFTARFIARRNIDCGNYRRRKSMVIPKGFFAPRS